MGVKKKPNLKVNIPSYPGDYVAMPLSTKRLILEANRMSNDIKFADEETDEANRPGTSQTPGASIAPFLTPGTSEIPKTPTGVVFKIDHEKSVTPEGSVIPKTPTGVAFKADHERSVTPEVKIIEPHEEKSNSVKDVAQNGDVESPVILRRMMKRNSVSAPAHLTENDIEALRKLYNINSQKPIPEHHHSTASAFSDGENTADEHNEILSDDERPKVPLRNVRRKPGAPRRLGRSEFRMDDEEYSPSNSVTSINSIASLLREKLQIIPQKIRNQKPYDYRLRAFVILVFLGLSFFIGFAYTLYYRKAESKEYFENVRIVEAKRILRIYNDDEVEILKANLAVDLNGKVKPFPCLPEHQKSDGSKCLEYLQTIRFYINKFPQDDIDNTTCYSIHWQALKHDVTPNDCFDWGDTKVHWYGGGQSLNLTWPLDTGYLDYTPFITGDIVKTEWSNVLRRYFINSKGVAIIVDDETPLHVAVNKENKDICLRAKYDDFAYVNKVTDLTEMRYNICTSQDMRALHFSVHNHQGAPLWDGLKPTDIETLESLISEPVWQIAPRFKDELQTETISNYTEDVINLGFLKQGHVLINEFWQNEIGDFDVDTNRFEALNETIDKLHRRGFKVAFTVQPYISTESKSFAECVQKRLLITERNADRRIPSLTRFKSSASAGMLDITNNGTVPWILEKLESVIDLYDIDAFYFDLGTAYDMPYYYQTEKLLINPDQYREIFIKTFEMLLNVIGVSSAVSLPRPPIFVSLPPFESSWEAIKLVIPTILTYGINGYPFIMPGAVGGDIYWPGSEQFVPSARSSFDYYNFNITNSTQENGIDLPEPELYMRWLQMATFLPVMKFTHLPSKYNDERVLEMAKNLTVLRQKVVTPLLLKYKREALEEGLPLIRPLWLVASGDPALIVNDEFVLGDEIVVAPVLEPGETSREVYLPAGLWQDGIDGSLRKGNRWMHDYKVPLERVAYFVKKPDDMRFK